MEKKEKIRSNRDFRKVYDKGKSFANKYMVIFFIQNSYGYNRFGFSTTKKIGKNVVRNKVKRRIKEICRLNSNRIKQGYDIIFLARVAAKDALYGQLENAFLHLIRVSGLMKKGE